MLIRKQFEIEMKKRMSQIIDLLKNTGSITIFTFLKEEGVFEFVEIRGGYSLSGMTGKEIDQEAYRDWLGVMWHKLARKELSSKEAGNV